MCEKSDNPVPSYPVSILVPVYGVEDWIERCARSLFEQTYPHLEFVFVDDCSPDASMDILRRVLEEYPARRESVRILRHEVRRGLASTRNTNLNAATGDFILIVDSDDYLEPDAVENLVNRQLETGADLIAGQYLVHFPETELLLKEKDYADRKERVFHMMQRGWSHFVAGRFIRRSLFTENGLHWVEGLDWAEDRYMMTLVAYHAKTPVTVDRVIYHYERRNANSMTGNVDRERYLRGNEQQLGNCLHLEQFFRDKEPEYQVESRRCVMEQLERNLQFELVYATKEGFENTVREIDERSPEDWAFIGWTKTGLKGLFLHSYACMRGRWLVRKTVRFVKKKIHRNPDSGKTDNSK